MFNHYLLLRYNLYLYGDNPYMVKDKDGWMKERLPLYKRLIKSLENQTVKDFTLIIAICENTPDAFIQEIEETTTVPYEICFVQPHEYIKAKIPKKDWLITSRIDNDDEYLPKFVETIQHNFRSTEELLDITVWQKQGNNYYTSGRQTPNSPFISLVEEWNNPKTAMYKPHSQMNGLFNSRFVGDSVLAIQHIHENNVINKLVGKPIKLRVVVGMATFDNRPFQKAVDSLSGQCDEIIIYDNNKAYDLTDNGKFFGLTLQDEPCYYLTVDDDLLYPEHYVKNLTGAIDRLGTIVTHHGRKLKGVDRSYYRGHDSYRCLDMVYEEKLIDVCGTGVTGFRTDYFNPVGIHLAEDKRKSDLVFSLEAARQGKEITLLKHGAGWIKHLPIDLSKTIHAQDSGNEKRHIEIANEIWRIKNNL